MTNYEATDFNPELISNYPPVVIRNETGFRVVNISTTRDICENTLRFIPNKHNRPYKRATRFNGGN